MLIAKGEPVIPALQEALTGAEESGRKVVEAAQPQPDAKKLILDWITARNKDFKADLTPVPLDDAATALAFPDFRFHLVAFRIYPVAMMPPAPLSNRQVFAISKDGQKVEYIADVEALKKFFKDHLAAVTGDQDAKTAVAAWLQVGKEFASDGMFQFRIAGDDITTRKLDQELEATGKAVVVTTGGPAGNQGAVAATLTFDAKGKLKQIDQVAKVRPGMRPICQSTKLLDPDEIVRRMAEQDLLLMGTAARDYLTAQRAKSSPELQQAIDAIWQKILAREQENLQIDPRLK